MAHQVFDNMFSETLVSKVENLLTAFPFDWHFVDWSSGGIQNPNDPFEKDSPQMVHMFCQDDNWISPYSGIIQHMLDVIKTETDLISIHKIKANLTMPDGTSDKHYNAPHQDHEQTDFLSMVYYVHDADGDTILFDRYHRDEKAEEATQVARVQPSRGRCVVFPSTQFHSSTNPIMFNKRTVLNFIFQV
jgi:hypothetical protein